MKNIKIVIGENMVKNIKKILPLIVISYAALMILVFLDGGKMYGTNADWLNQHIVFPDAFRKHFYESENLFTNFIYNIGGGQNIFNFVYYGYLNPVILISYFLPFVDMTTYVMVASGCLYVSMGVMMYVFIKHHYGKMYGYTFEHEATYEKMCLVNDAVYIAKYADPELCKDLYGYIPGDNKKKGGKWTATGTQFAVPYVFKSLFSHELITIDDMCETKSVKTEMYLDYQRFDEHNYCFVGKVGSFCPVVPEADGGILVRKALDKNGNVKYDAVTGTKGYRWLQADVVRERGDINIIDRSFYKNLVDDAIESIGKYVDPEAFMD